MPRRVAATACDPRLWPLLCPGMDVVRKMETYGSQSGKTSKKIVIANCGQI